MFLRYPWVLQVLTEDEPNFPRQKNLLLYKILSDLDKVVNCKDFPRPNKEI